MHLTLIGHNLIEQYMYEIRVIINCVTDDHCLAIAAALFLAQLRHDGQRVRHLRLARAELAEHLFRGTLSAASPRRTEAYTLLELHVHLRGGGEDERQWTHFGDALRLDAAADEGINVGGAS